MLIEILQAYAQKLGLDVDFSDISESTEDFLDVSDPDLNFNDVREKILSNVVLSKKVSDQTIASVELLDSIWIDGNKVNVDILFEVGRLGFGTRAKVVVKTVEVVVGDSVKSFLSIEAYKSYINSKVVGA